MTYTEQLEQESEQTRQRLAFDLEELRARISPGQVVDQVVDYIQDGSGAAFARNLKRQVVDNPLPVTLMGAGLAWLMLANGSKAPDRSWHRYDGGAVDNAASQVRAGLSSVSETASEARRRAGGMVDATVSAGRQFASSTQDAASTAYTSVTEGAERTRAAVADSAKRISRNADAVADFCREQPLVLAAVGVALGAALGAILPATRTEDRLIGDAGAEAKESIRDTLSEVMEKASAVGDRAVEAAVDEASKQGLTQGAEDEHSAGEMSNGQSAAPRTLELQTAEGHDPDQGSVLITPPPPAV